jgi:hypothetical protein
VIHHLIIVSDLHIGSTVALCKPTVALDDGGSYNLSPCQWQLWHWWEDFISRVSLLDGTKTLVLNGDTIEGDSKRRSHQIITQNRSTLTRIAVETLEPLLSEVNKTYVVRGTEAHTDKSGSLEETIARDIGAVSETEIKSHWFLLLDIDGIRVDIAHHTSMGGLPWTLNNAGNALAARTIMYYVTNGERVPDLVVRSHVHRWGDSFDAFPLRAIITPAWTFATAYINRINPSNIAQVGALIISIEDGKYEATKWRTEPPRRLYTRI